MWQIQPILVCQNSKTKFDGTNSNSSNQDNNDSATHSSVLKGIPDFIEVEIVNSADISTLTKQWKIMKCPQLPPFWINFDCNIMKLERNNLLKLMTSTTISYLLIQHWTDLYLSVQQYSV